MLKRILLVVGGVALALVLAMGALLAATFMGRRAIEEGREIGSTRLVVDGFSTVGVVRAGERSVLLVDSGQDADAASIVAELTRRGLAADTVVAILITHGHLDHTGGIAHFPNAQVMALEAEVPVIEGRAGTQGPVTRFFPTSDTGITVSRALRDGETLTIGDATVRVFAVPGHTAGSAAYLIDGVLFVGDSADVSSEGAIVGAPWMFSDNQEQNRASLRALAERLDREQLEVRAIVPAHSGAVEGVAPLLAFAQQE